MSDLTPIEQQQVEQFLSFDFPEQRGEWLAQKTEAGRQATYAALARYEDLQLDDIIGLPAPWRHEANFHLIGNDHETMKIRPCGRSFAIGPVDKPVKVENGTERGKRLWLTIDKPVMLETRKAIDCLIQYGKHAEHEHCRGKLKQMSMGEVNEWHMAQAAAKSGKSDKSSNKK